MLNLLVWAVEGWPVVRGTGWLWGRKKWARYTRYKSYTTLTTYRMKDLIHLI